MTTPEAVLEFWLDEIGPEGWYVGAKIDALVRDRFEETWTRAAAGGLTEWLSSPRSALAYLIVTDQLPRNMFRDTARAFSTDAAARSATKLSVEAEWDLRIAEPARQFFYMPLMHSEYLPDQERCVRLIKTRMPETGAETLLHARAHRAIIRRFGRFPFRNAALGRTSKPEETAFIETGGYMALVKELRPVA
jgi:uncharacterized protein (DUF924 family)